MPPISCAKLALGGGVEEAVVWVDPQLGEEEGELEGTVMLSFVVSSSKKTESQWACMEVMGKGGNFFFTFCSSDLGRLLR